MRKTVLIVTFFACLFLAGGCDFFRGLAGRPTSADIALKREALQNKAAMEQKAAEDSLAAAAQVQRETSDPPELVSRLEQSSRLNKLSRKLDAASAASLDKRYYVMVGYFSEASNAASLASRLDRAGFTAVLLKYAAGGTAVGVNPSDRLSDAYDSLQRLVGLDYIPEDSYILDVSSL